MENLLEVKDLSISYDGNTVLDHVNLTVVENEIVSIVGESGSGKTTLINSVMHMLNAKASMDSGEIWFDGQNLGKLTKKQWKSVRGDTIGMIFQNAKSFLNPIRKIHKQFEDTICAHRDVSRHRAREMAVEVLVKMGFADPQRVLSSYSYQLSGGMNQRVAIAMCLVLGPKILLADEPTSALDVVSQSQVVDELRRVRDDYNTTVIMVTHNIGCAAHLSDRLVVMNDGKIVEVGATAEIIRSPKQAYTKKLLGAIPELKGHCRLAGEGADHERHNFAAL